MLDELLSIVEPVHKFTALTMYAILQNIRYYISYIYQIKWNTGTKVLNYNRAISIQFNEVLGCCKYVPLK